MPNPSDNYVRFLPDEKYLQIAADATVRVSIDPNQECRAIKYQNATGRPLTLKTNTTGLIEKLQTGLTVRNYTSPIYQITIINDDDVAEDGALYLYFSDEELPDQPDTVPYTNAIQWFDANDTNTVVNGLDTVSIVPSITGDNRFRMLGCRLTLAYMIEKAAAGSGFTTAHARLFGNPFSTNFRMELNVTFRHGAALGPDVQSGQVDSGWETFPEPGIVFTAGDVPILRNENISGGGNPPSNVRQIAAALVIGIVEPISG